MRLAQLDRAFGYGPKGRGFESSSARVKKKAGLIGPAFFLKPASRLRTGFEVSPAGSVGS